MPLLDARTNVRLFFRNALLNFVPFKDIYGLYLRNLYFYYNT